jgi:hypothetical protein
MASPEEWHIDSYRSGARRGRISWLLLNWSYALRTQMHCSSIPGDVARFNSRFLGTAPGQNSAGVLFFACDERYMEKFGYSLILSCHENAPECGVHVHLYEPSSATMRKLSLLQKRLSSNLSYTFEKNIDFGTLPDRRWYYTAFRFLVAKKISEESSSLVICVDADSLVRKSLQPIVELGRTQDVGLFYRSNKRGLRKKIGAFCVVLNNTPGCFDFINFYGGIILKFWSNYPRFSWPFDQSALYLSFLRSRLQHRTSLWHLDDSAVGFEFPNEACIWTAKGRQKNDQMFIKDAHRILDKFNHLLTV